MIYTPFHQLDPSVNKQATCYITLYSHQFQLCTDLHAPQGNTHVIMCACPLLNNSVRTRSHKQDENRPHIIQLDVLDITHSPLCIIFFDEAESVPKFVT